ncbi:MAG: hypothetical protein TRG1_3069 [Flavobacteriaceae bacterium FS1-H7996/R]|nr:MAG: hypothetical protein TRG1_3069 [Flavobacteriaceae bacterium FS1-H7996/R]
MTRISTICIVSTMGIIHLNPGCKVLIYLPNLNFKARLYSKIMRIPDNRNTTITIVNIKGGFIIYLFLVNTQLIIL